VVGNDQTGDEIWLVKPDTGSPSKIWSSSRIGTEGIQDVTQLAWSPSGQELAFAGRHENYCSFYYSDIYALRPDGSGYRRITSPPACGQQSGMPTGTVNVVVTNYSGTGGPFTVYFEGAGQAKDIFLAPGTSTTVTFQNVADYGNRVQWAVASFGGLRFHDVLSNANVIPGQTVTTQGEVPIIFGIEYWGWRWPTWRSDGSQLAYVFQASGSFYGIPAGSQVPGSAGQEILNVPISERPGDPEHLSYGPTPERRSQILYAAYDFDGGGSTIFLVEEGSTNPGQVLVEVGGGEGRYVLGLSWLPDGSGFLYSATEEYGEQANLFAYYFAAGASTRLTNFTNSFTRLVSVSPDGQRAIFERQVGGDWTDEDPYIDLWMMNIDGTGAQLFIEDARSPAWGIIGAAQPPPSLAVKIFLPIITRP
jgi:Tol biopolymer transport system component